MSPHLMELLMGWRSFPLHMAHPHVTGTELISITPSHQAQSAFEHFPNQASSFPSKIQTMKFVLVYFAPNKYLVFKRIVSWIKRKN